MFTLATRIGLSILVMFCEALARLFMPSRQVSMAYSRGMYGSRHWTHLNVYHAAPGWLFVEVGSWTIQASWRTQPERSRLKFTA